jgi:peroxiredoxin
MKIKVGQPAPPFKLIDTNRQELTLDQFKSKNLLLLFFPFAFTGTCTKELCAIRDSLHDYAALNAEVVAVSVDSIHSLRRYKDDQQFNFTLASDFNKEVSAAYGALYELFGLFKGVSKRAAFVIDGNGIVQYAEVLINASAIPDFEAIKSVLARLSQ